MKRGHTLAAGIALIVLANVVALGGAWWNRTETESTLTLSERELGLPWRNLRTQENSGLALNLRWRVANPAGHSDYVSGFSIGSGAPDWLDGAKLQTLGFEVGDLQTDAGQRQFTRQQPRQVILVLELDGPTRQKVLDQANENAERHAAAAAVNADSKEFATRAKQAQEALIREQDSNSRLFAIDAGLDADALRRQYPDTSRYMLLAGTVRPRLHHPERGTSRPAGYLAGTVITNLHVPRALAAPLEGMNPEVTGKQATPNRFAATIAVGRRLEPWVVAVQPGQ